MERALYAVCAASLAWLVAAIILSAAGSRGPALPLIATAAAALAFAAALRRKRG